MKYLIKRILLNVLICTGLISAMSASVALTQDEEPVLTIFQRGIQQFNEKKFEEAKNNFFLAYQKEDSNPTFSYNLALSFGELNQGPQTLAYLRRAQELNPFSLEYRKAWEYYSKKFPVPEMPRRLGTWDFFIEQLRWIPSVLIFLPLLILMGFSGSLVTRRIRKKKSGVAHQSSLVVSSVSAAFLVIFGLLYGAKVYDKSLVRGTLVFNKASDKASEGVSLKSAPDESAAEITQFPLGIEVIVQQKQEDWLKVQYPGSFTGWVKQEVILITSLTSSKQIH